MDFTQTGSWFQPAMNFQGTFDLKIFDLPGSENRYSLGTVAERMRAK